MQEKADISRVRNGDATPITKPEQAQVPQNDYITPDSDIKTAYSDDNSTDNDDNSTDNNDSSIEGKPARDDIGVINDGSNRNRNRSTHPCNLKDFGISDDRKFVHDPGGNNLNTKDDLTHVDDDNSPASSISNKPCIADAQCSDDCDRDKTIPSGSPFDANAIPVKASTGLDSTTCTKR